MDHQVNDDLAEQIDAELARIIPRKPTAKVLELPVYNHHPEVDDVGRLSAEALAMSFEGSANRIEEMAKHLWDEVKSCEQSTLEIVRELDAYKDRTRQAVDECKRAAKAYRDEAKVLFEHVQSRALVADKVRQACLEMIGNIKT
jgi:hypothetical protein